MYNLLILHKIQEVTQDTSLYVNVKSHVCPGIKEVIQLCQ